MKKTVSLLLTFLIVATIFSGCSNTNKLVGEWKVSDISIDEDLGGYPEENFIIFDDGTFTGDGASGSYSQNENILSLKLSSLYTQSYEYEISGDTLILKNVEADEDEPAIYYERVSR